MRRTGRGRAVGLVAVALVGLVPALMGAGIGDAAIGGGGGTFTTTTSTTRHTTVVRVDLPAVTVVVAVADGEVVASAEAAGPPDGPEASAMILALGGSVLDVATADELVGEATTHIETSVTTSTTFGPATILIGEDQSETFFVAPGTTNVNTNTHTEQFVEARYRVVTTVTVDVGTAAVSPRFTG